MPFGKDPFASTELLKNEYADDNPFVADPFSDPQHEDEYSENNSGSGNMIQTAAPHQPPLPPSFQQPLKAAHTPTVTTSASASTPTKPGPPSKPSMSYSRPSELPDDVVEALSKILGSDINVRELFSRLERTRQNAEAWARGDRSSELHDSKRDLSKHLFHDGDDAGNGYRDDEGKPKPPSLAKRAAFALRKALGVSGDASGSEETVRHQQVSAYATGAKPLPNPPSHIHADDKLSLAIYYHEREELDISAIYLEQSAMERNPLGLYLRGLTLRHGWGVPEDKEAAFRSLLESAESCLMTIPEVAERRKKRAESSSASSPFDSPYSTLDKKSKTRPADLRSLRSYATVASLLPEDIHTATALLPLPLFELGMCFRQGWGVLKSYPAAVYYFGIAARLGDPDAMYELGYCYLNGTPGTASSAADKSNNKVLAAMWLREADKHDKKVVGESWIWKKKWGGNED
ncbi:hypothetical protein HDU97_007604 [Phlyctochytrium planicorne]|nr:hypothetical protein HDU97_007604 [Phlyctochytrium planicorne]